MDRRAQDDLLEVLDNLRQQVGPNGIIVPIGSVRYYPLAVALSGFVYPLGLVARAFADPETKHIDLTAPKVLVYDGILGESGQLRHGLVPVLEQLKDSKTHSSLAIFALDIDGAVLEGLINTHRRRVCNIAAIGCYGMGRDEARHYLSVIARMCGATMLGAAARAGKLWSWSDALGSAGRILADRRRVVFVEPARIDLADIAAQSIGLLSVSGNDARDVQEGIEWIEGLLGY